MFPANSSHLTKMPNIAHKFLRHLFERKGCRVIKSDDMPWSSIKGGINLFLKLESSNSPFHSTDYSQICSALVFPRFVKSTKLERNCIAIVQVADVGMCAHVQKVIDNVCRLHDFSPSRFSVIDSSNEGLYNKNVVDFLCGDTRGFSTRLLAEQLKYSKEGGVRLSHVLRNFVDILDWEHAYDQQRTNVMLRLESPQDPASFKVLEHVLRRDSIRYPIVIETPKFDVKVNYPFNDFMNNSVYETYQYCLSIPDSAIALALNTLTTHDGESIDDIVQTHEESPAKYYGQKKIAENLLAINHNGDEQTMADCEQASTYLYTTARFSQDHLESIERVIHTIPLVYCEGLTLTGLCEQATLNLSPAHGNLFNEFIKKVLRKGSLVCNGRRIFLDHKFTKEDILSARSILTLNVQKNKTAFMVKWEIPG